MKKGRRNCCVCCCLFVLVVIITLIIIIATFKIPGFSLSGVTTDPNHSLISTSSNLTLSFIVKGNVNNQNFFGISTDYVIFEGYSSLSPSQSIMSGQIKGLSFGANSVSPVTLPISLQLNPSQDATAAKDILKNCVLGSGDLNLDYRLRVKITLVPTEVKHDLSLAVPCPNLGAF